MSASSRPAAFRRFRYCPLVAALACAFPGAALAVPTDIPVATAAQFATALGQVVGPTSCDPNGSRIIATGPFTVSVASALPTIGCPNVEIAGNGNITILAMSSGGTMCGLNAAPTTGLTKVSGVTVSNFSYGGSGMCGKLEATANTVSANDKGFTLNGGAIVTGNTITANPVWGIYDTGTGSTISQNTIDRNGYGIYAANAMVIDDNDITNNTNKGIYGLDSMVISNNTITGNTQEAIRVWDAATITGNLIAGNNTGIRASEGYVIKANIVRDHVNGLLLDDGGTIGGPSGTPGAGDGNVVYNNVLNIRVDGTSTGGPLSIVNNWVGTSDGATPAGGTYGVYIYSQTASYSITGNVIGGHSSAGLHIRYPSGPGTISGNRIGVDASGTVALPNQNGIQLWDLSGGALTLDNNVISGNLGDGVQADNSPNLTFTNNRIGTNAPGTAGIGNGGSGVYAYCSGALTFSGNVISSNGMYGGDFDQVTGSRFDNNFIGTTAGGTSALANGTASSPAAGIRLNSNPCLAARSNPDLEPKVAKVAIDNVFDGNVVAYNNGDGIVIWSGVGNFIRGGSIHSNTGKNISLDFSSGPLQNDTPASAPPSNPPDLDSGPNDRQNYPDITSAVLDSGDTVVQFTLQSTPGTSFDIQFYSNVTAGVHAGQTFVPGDVMPVTTNASGIASGSRTLAGSRANVTTTATGPSGTSEFSAPVAPLVPAASVLPSMIPFGNVVVGATSPAQEVTFTSTGTGPYIVDSLLSATTLPACPGNGVSICASGDFSCATTCVPGTPYATTNPQTAACKITGVTFHPLVTGPQAATIYVCDNTSATARAIALSGTGIPITLSAAPSSYGFGNVVLGSRPLSSPIVISNSTPATAVILSSVPSGPFTIESSTCASTLPPGASCSFTMAYQPSTLATHTGSLTMNLDNFGNPVVVPLTGTGIPITLSAAPGSHDFGNVALGSRALSPPIVISNPTPAAAVILSSIASGPFTIDNSTCASTLAPGASCSFTMAYQPSALATHTGSLTVSLGNSGNPVVVPLSGSGIPITLSAAPPSYNFGNVALGSRALSPPIVISNPTPAAAVILSSVASGPFTIESSTCASTLPPGASCSVTMAYQPSAVATQTGSLTISLGDSGNPVVVPLSGTGQATVGRLSLPSTIDLGTAVLLSSPLQHSLELRNVGSINVDFVLIAATPPFVVSHDCPASLAGGAACVANISFQPLLYGLSVGQLTVLSNAEGPGGTISLLASVSGVPYAISPSEASFGQVHAGTRSPARTFVLANNGDNTVPLSGISVSAPFTIVTNTCGSSLGARSSCAVAVAFEPVQAGGIAGWLTAGIGLAGAPPAEALLSGAGIQQPALVLPESIDFGSVVLGSVPSITQTLQLRNTGNALLTFTAGASGPFVLSGDCQGTLAAAGACNLLITFTPAAAGEFRGALAIVSNAPGASRSIDLAVRVRPRVAPFLQISPTYIGFGERIAGTLSATQRVTITNDGGSDAILGPITAGADFVVNSQCGALLAPAASCGMDVAMRPLGFGLRSGQLQFTSNATASPHVVELQGTGCRPFAMFSSRSGLRSNCAP